MIRLAAILAVLAGAATAQPLPFAMGGPFTLTDQTGGLRTEADPDGNPQLLFFGYANCQEICSAVLPLMADLTDRAAASGHAVTPVMITVAPEVDTVQTLGPALAAHHPDFVGLTGDLPALQTAWDAFSIEREELFWDPEFGPVYAHGSFVYLLDGDGAVLTLIPPVLSADQAADVMMRYLDQAA